MSSILSDRPLNIDGIMAFGIIAADRKKINYLT
jgi:hypothetical protein